jgi:hypothetical protein
MGPRHARSLFGALLALLVCAPAPAHSQDRLDAPELVLVQGSRSKVRLQVTAGPSGAPAGFTVTWMAAADFAARGGVWPEGASDDAVRLGFTGVATLNTWGETERSFRLGPHEMLDTEIGDLTDETGVTGLKVGELPRGMDFVFRVVANATAEAAASLPSATVLGTTTPQVDCTYTQGYWKSHQAAWPVASLMLGSVSYTKTQLVQILLGVSVRGNGLLSLAHQLIATKLNVAAGANPAAVAAAIAAADAAIGSLVVPPIGAGSLPPGETSAITQVLDDYNNGLSGPGTCDTVPGATATWGRIKSLYR